MQATETNPNKALWEKGDFTRLAATMRGSGDDLVDTFGIRAGMQVLELGCGDGTTAIPAAQRGAVVRGIDIARNLVAAGNRRAAEFGLANCSFEEGDASDLIGVQDDSFDLVVSIFGAMFAPRPFDVAREMVRVARPGGRVIMGNWIPNDPTLVAQILRIASAHTPPPPEGFVSPMLWGLEEHVLDRFGAAGIPAERVSFSRETFTFVADSSPAEYLRLFEHYYGPTMNAFEAARSNGTVDALRTELAALFERENISGQPDRTVIPATMLLVRVDV